MGWCGCFPVRGEGGRVMAAPFGIPDRGPFAPSGRSVCIETDGRIVLIGHSADYGHIDRVFDAGFDFDFIAFLRAQQSKPECLALLSQFASMIGDSFSLQCKALRGNEAIRHLETLFLCGHLRVFSAVQEDPLGSDDFAPDDPAPAWIGSTAEMPEAVFHGLSTSERFQAAMKAASLTDELTAAAKAMLEPANLAIMAAVIGVLAGAAAVSGPVVLAVGWVAFGWSVFDIASQIWDFVSGVLTAAGPGELVVAGGVFAALLLALTDLLPVGKLMSFFKRIGSRIGAGGKKSANTTGSNVDSAVPKPSSATENRPPKQVNDIAERFEALRQQGHGPQRHEGEVSRQQLIDRATKGYDPMTNSRVDGVHGGEHVASRHATRIKTPEAYVNAEKTVSQSLKYRDERDLAIASGKKRFEVRMSLEEVFGSEFQKNLEGITRLGSAKNPKGYLDTDFSNGSIVARYALEAGKEARLITMFPNP